MKKDRSRTRSPSPSPPRGEPSSSSTADRFSALTAAVESLQFSQKANHDGLALQFRQHALNVDSKIPEVDKRDEEVSNKSDGMVERVPALEQAPKEPPQAPPWPAASSHNPLPPHTCPVTFLPTPVWQLGTHPRSNKPALYIYIYIYVYRK